MLKAVSQGAGGGGSGTVKSVTGLNTNNTDPTNPVVQISVDGVTITGAGTPGSPLAAVTGGGGDVVGPASATDNAFARFDGTTGKLIQNSSVTADDSGNVTATSFTGGGAGLTSITAANISAGTAGIDISGNAATATTATNITVANEATDTTCFPTFVTAATGNLPPKSNAALTYNSNTSNLASTTFTGALVGNATTATAWATGRTLAITGDLAYTSPALDGSGNVTAAGTLATVNSNVGSFTNASITVNGKGLVTAASNGAAGVASVSGTTNRITVTGGTTTAVVDIAATYVGQTSITTLGTITTGTWSGLFGAVSGANLTTLTAANISAGTAGIDISGNATTATTATNVTVANEATDTTCFPLFATAATGNLPPKSNANLTYNSNTSNLGSTTFTGALVGNATTATAWATGRTIAITGDLAYTSPSIDGSGNVTAAGTLATVNSNVGSFTNASVTVNAKGLVTAASSGSAGVASVSGTTNRITVTGGTTTAVVDISTSYVGQATITTLGTITTGVWTGTDIAFANIAQGSARSVLGVTGNGTADLASIQGTADQALVVNGAGTALAFGTVATGGITNSAVTYAKIQNVSATQRILGRNTAGAGVVEEVTASQTLDWIGATQGQVLYRDSGGWAALSPGASGQVLQSGGAAANPSWLTVTGTGTVTTVSVASTNGFAGSVATATTTPVITISTSITGVLKGNGTAISAAAAGTDYVAPGTATVFTAQQNFQSVSLTDASTITWNAATQQVAKVLLTAAVGGTRALGAPSNLVDGGTYILKVTQSATGSNALTYNAVYKWPSGTAPTLSTANNAIDILTFISDGTNMYGVAQKTFS